MTTMTLTLIKPIKVTATTVTLNRADYETLVAAAEGRSAEALFEAAEDRADAAAFARFDADVAERGLDAVLAEALPIEAVEKLAEGLHPLRVWREHRGLSASALATAAGVSVSYISEIEGRKKPGSIATMAKLAKALGVRLDVLVD